MRFAELLALKRGDVVRWNADNALGLVVKMSNVGPCVLWESPVHVSGPYSAVGDAERMSLVSKVSTTLDTPDSKESQ